MIRIPAKRQAGLTLLEVAIALAILGVILAGTIDLYTRATQQQKIRITYDNMNAISMALSIYAETAGRVPCPADPSINNITFGWEYGVVAANLAVAGNTTINTNTISHFPVGSCGSLGSGDGAAVNNPTEGIVPFMTLGLPAKTALDGWGHYFTYAVSPVFARHNDQVTAQLQTTPSTKDYGTVHGRCRHAGWVSGGSNNANLNPVKARFCCADQLTQVLPASPIVDTTSYDNSTDIVMNSAIDNSPLIPQRVAASTASYKDINKPTVQTDGTVNNEPYIDESAIEAPAFVLISHGPNGYGAYEADNALDRLSSTGASLVELKNIHDAGAASNVPYVDGPLTSTFHDIVRWMTQDTLLAAHGASSCQYP